MAKIGNYVHRDTYSRFRSQRKPSWSDYNKAWTKRRQASAKRLDKLNALAYTMQVVNTQASQANTLFVLQNQGRLGHYGNQTAAMARINVVV
ncbi:flagellar biosynthesis protein [Roseibium sp. Sym1]|uniref:flagellar biosynthesis protein n=1 Tax=Roseibium sp. Sym1 TaxID=3016006 RepID=UPI0022B2E5B5|nr:flagellar biosynthesis protein [Roseibium sp. Sym1]